MVIATVGVNGVAMDALVDMGSPVTIISLASAVLAKERGRYSSVEEWREDAVKRFNVMLKNYRGQVLDILPRSHSGRAQGHSNGASAEWCPSQATPAWGQISN